jgi:SRSO17 transposase
MLARAFDAGVPCAWVVGDSVYGSDSALRRAVERSGRGYVLEVTSAQRLGLRRVDAWAADLPEAAWRRLSAGDGAKGPRLYDWAFLPFRGAAAGWAKGLLVRRKIARPDELAFHLTLAPEATPLAELVRIAGMRWTIEACFEAAKGEVGLDHYEVRSWTGWHRHVTLAMLAHAYLTVVCKAALGGRRRGARPQGRPAAPHRAGGAPAHLALGLGAPARSRPGRRVVALAPQAPAARPPLPLAATAAPA